MAAVADTATLPTAQATPLASADLVRQARAGDRAAFEVLVHRHFGAVYAAAYARLDQREAAEDLAQEVFLRAWLHLGTLKSPEAFESWVMRMARHLSISWRRNSRRRSELVPMVTPRSENNQGQSYEEDAVTQAPDTAADPREVAAAAEERERLRAALGKLPAADRELVIRHFIDEQSQRDMARTTGEHHTTIGRRLASAMARLRALAGGKAAPVSAPAAMLARPDAAGRACAVIAAASVLAPAAQEVLRAKAAGSTATFLASLQANAAIAAEGVFIMGAAQKLAVAATAAALMIGGGTYVYQHSGLSPSVAMARSLPLATRQEGVALGREYITTIRPGEVLRIDMANMPGDQHADFNDFYVGSDGRLMVRAIKGGAVQGEGPLYPVKPEEAAGNFTTCQVWPEQQLCLVATANGRPAPDGNGFEVALYANNRPDLIPKAVEIEEAFHQGKIPKREVARRLTELLAASQMLPNDERSRAQLLTLIQRDWQ